MWEQTIEFLNASLRAESLLLAHRVGLTHETIVENQLLRRGRCKTPSHGDFHPVLNQLMQERTRLNA
jgi:hypothetical protein